MKAIILSAGQGKRLLPLTESSPKCLLPVSGSTTVLGWQIEQLATAGVTEAVIVTGFYAERVETELQRYRNHMLLRHCFNPFFSVADNLGSLWVAREEMNQDFIILNGDTLFTYPVAKRLLDEAQQPITLTVAHKPNYDTDDMKVVIEDGRLRAVGKTLPPEGVNGESIGMMLFKGEGTSIFRRTVEDAMRDERSLKRWYLSIIHELAASVNIGTVSAAGEEWCEVDFPSDYEHATRAVAGWQREQTAQLVSNRG